MKLNATHTQKKSEYINLTKLTIKIGEKIGNAKCCARKVFC